MQYVKDMFFFCFVFFVTSNRFWFFTKWRMQSANEIKELRNIYRFVTTSQSEPISQFFFFVLFSFRKCITVSHWYIPFKHRGKNDVCFPVCEAVSVHVCVNVLKSL